uniref:Uncharacterized protein n=1 Tax=Quercus lobata TaxID=97700 RepID=A0A7N2QXN4_QUELO
MKYPSEPVPQKDVHQYNSFTEMLGPESLAKVLPGVETLEEGELISLPFLLLMSQCLVSALLESINSKAFCRPDCGLKFIPEGSSLKQEENEWQKLVLDKRSKIVNMTSRNSNHVAISLSLIMIVIFLVMAATTRTCPLTSIRYLTYLEKILSLHNYRLGGLSDRVVGHSCAQMR